MGGILILMGALLFSFLPHPSAFATCDEGAWVPPEEGSKTSHYESLKAYIEEKNIKKRSKLMDCLPDEYKENYTLGYASTALGGERNSSAEYPRAVLYGQTGKMTMGFFGNRDREEDSIEILEAHEGKWVNHYIEFKGGPDDAEVEFDDSKKLGKCMSCHGDSHDSRVRKMKNPHLKPIWGKLGNWAGYFGSDDGNLMKKVTATREDRTNVRLPPLGKTEVPELTSEESELVKFNKFLSTRKSEGAESAYAHLKVEDFSTPALSTLPKRDIDAISYETFLKVTKLKESDLSKADFIKNYETYVEQYNLGPYSILNDPARRAYPNAVMGGLLSAQNVKMMFKNIKDDPQYQKLKYIMAANLFTCDLKSTYEGAYYGVDGETIGRQNDTLQKMGNDQTAFSSEPTEARYRHKMQTNVNKATVNLLKKFNLHASYFSLLRREPLWASMSDEEFAKVNQSMEGGMAYKGDQREPSFYLLKEIVDDLATEDVGMKGFLKKEGEPFHDDEFERGKTSPIPMVKDFATRGIKDAVKGALLRGERTAASGALYTGVSEATKQTLIGYDRSRSVNMGVCSYLLGKIKSQRTKSDYLFIGAHECNKKFWGGTQAVTSFGKKMLGTVSGMFGSLFSRGGGEEED